MTDGSAQRLVQRYQSVRERTEQLAAPLSDEDQQVQSMPACSPTKWHRAHTTWFFETFLLAPRGVPAFDPRFGSIFNSYYNTLGTPFARAARGLLTRPTAREIGAYRRSVDGRMIEALLSLSPPELAEVLPLVELGLAHEEQHQELLLTDILHAFAQNPLAPVYRSLAARADTRPDGATPSSARQALEFHRYDGGLVECGGRGECFAFDNEQPRHRVYLEPFALASRLVTWAELSAFVTEQGYRTPSLWLADGWDFVRSEGLCAPLYSRLEGGEWRVFSLRGERTPSPDEPVAHLSYYEADAVARFLGARLPSESEWEHVAARASVEGHFLEAGELHPLPAPRSSGPSPAQLFGDVWEWTASAYQPYPGYRPGVGALGEYNGKFMSGQQVLRGGSCFTPAGHVSASYRNFWQPGTRFQMAGARLARDARL